MPSANKLRPYLPIFFPKNKWKYTIFSRVFFSTQEPARLPELSVSSHRIAVPVTPISSDALYTRRVRF